MTSREQLKSEIDFINEAHIEILHRMILALGQTSTLATPTTYAKAPNPLKDSVVFEQDLVAPIGEEWDVEQC